MLGLWGFADFLAKFLRKFFFLVFTRKLHKIFKVKYGLQLIGLSMMMYYYSREIRICMNPAYESTLIKMSILLSHTLMSLACQILISQRQPKHIAYFKVELLIYNSVFFHYMLSYPICHPVLTFTLHQTLLMVSKCVQGYNACV
jgi:hypothetical protein